MVTMVLAQTASFTKVTVVVQNFKNPNSDTAIPGISASLSSSTGSSRATYTSAVLSNLQPDKMTAASLAPQSNLIGDSGTILMISLTPKNILKANGKVNVLFPYWS